MKYNWMKGVPTAQKNNVWENSFSPQFIHWVYKLNSVPHENSKWFKSLRVPLICQ